MRTAKVLLLAGIVLMPFSSAKACNVRPYALSYINKINNVLGGTKPKLAIEDGSEEDYVGAYEDGVIYIHKGDYEGKCGDETPYLKSVISHEYAHYASGKLKKVTKLKGEKLAYTAEHAIGDTVFGDNIEYDNDADFEHPKDYDAIKNFLLAKQTKNIAAKSTGALYFKNRK